MSSAGGEDAVHPRGGGACRVQRLLPVRVVTGGAEQPFADAEEVLVVVLGGALGEPPVRVLEQHVALGASRRTCLHQRVPVHRRLAQHAERQAAGRAGRVGHHHVLGTRPQDGLLVGRRRAALLGGEEARPHLHAVGAERDEAADVLVRVDPAGHDHRQVAVGRRHLFDRRQEPLEGVLLEVDLVGAKAEVTAGQRPLEHDRVGAHVLALPAPADDRQRARRRDDRDECGAARRLYGRQRERQAGARDDRVGAGVDGGAHRGDEVALERHHDVDAGEAAARLGRLHLKPHGLVGAHLAPEAPGDDPVEPRAGDQPQAARGGHGRRQGSERNADAHAALEDGQSKLHALDGEEWQRGGRD